jgi:hypothetical protein
MMRRRPWVAPPRDVAVPIMPRSRLFSLEPRGVGTAEIEGLSGYIIRLAEEHCVPPGMLIGCAAPGVLGRNKRGANVKSAPGGFWVNTSHTLNGTGVLAHAAVETISDATCQPTLHSLTLLPWANVLPPQRLLRRTKAWCPSCYRDWRDSGDTPYLPLIWSIAVVTLCLRHRLPLLTRCPHIGCGHEEPILSHHSLIEYCTRCGGWRGAMTYVESTSSRVDDIDLRVWEAEAVGAILAAAPTLIEPPRRGRIAEIADAWATTQPESSCEALARLTGQPAATLQGWGKGHRPSLPTLLHICRVLNTTTLLVS